MFCEMLLIFVKYWLIIWLTEKSLNVSFMFREMFCVAHFRKILVSYLADRKVQVAQCFLYVSWKFCVVYFCEIFTLLYFDLAYNQILFSMRCPSFENIIVGRSKSGNKRAVFTLRVSKIIDCVFVLIINFLKVLES